MKSVYKLSKLDMCRGEANDLELFNPLLESVRNNWSELIYDDLIEQIESQKNNPVRYSIVYEY